jgi:ADP-heptose:LPS heptosyltransferase
MNRHLLIFLDKTAFRVLFWLVVLWSKLRRRALFRDPVPLGDRAHVLVIRPGGLGDGIMSVPLLRALRAGLPQARITVVCLSKNRAALELLPYHDELIVLNAPGGRRKLREGRPYDVVLDLEPFRRVSAIVAWFSGAPVRVGFDTGVRRRLYTHLVTYAHDHGFDSENMVRQLRFLGIAVPAAKAVDLGIDLPEEARAGGLRFLEGSGADPGRDFLVAVAPGVLKPHHRWKMEEFGRLVDRILERDETARVVLVGSAADRQDADDVLARVADKERVADLVGKTSYSESLAVLERCRILVACDGGVVYMAAAMGCATISLWGPGVMERFKPPGERHVGVRKDYACIPCVLWDRLGEFPACPYDRRCYNDLTAEEVFERYEALASQRAADS